MMEGGKNLDGKPKITMLDVWEGRAHRTAGGLKKTDLMINKKNRVVSRRKHELGIRNFTGFRAKLCDGDFDLSKFKPTYSAKYMPKKKKPPARDISQSPKERVQKMLSVRKTEDEIIDTYKRFRERFKDIIEPAEKRESKIAESRDREIKRLADPNRKLDKDEWIKKYLPKGNKSIVFNTLKRGDNIVFTYPEGDPDIYTGVVNAKNIKIKTREGNRNYLEDGLQIRLISINGNPKEPQYIGFIKELITRIIKVKELPNVELRKLY